MTYNHEYHIAGTLEVAALPKVSVPPRAVSLNRILVICAIFGAVSLFLVGMIIHPLISQSQDNPNNNEHTSGSLLSNNSIGILSIVANELAEENDGHIRQDKSLQNLLSPPEEDAIRNLRLEVEDKLTSSFMKTATYLRRWLIARNWDIQEAKEMLLDHLEWRAEYEMDSVLEANLTFFEMEYPVYEDGFDYHGAKVYTVNFGDWDLRKLTVGGHERDFLRYFFRMFERGVKHAEELYIKRINANQGMCILNLNNYSIKKHGCFSCLPLITQIMFGMDDNYPGWLHHIILINSSDLAGVLVDMMLPYLNGENRAAIQVYGFNKAEWQQKILSLTAPDQIRPEFGGTKVDSDDLNEL